MSGALVPFAVDLERERAARSAGKPGLRFRSAAELRAATPEEPPWTWSGFLARGSLALVAGKPKVGKSTLVGAVLEAVVTGAQDFLGRGVRGGPAVLLTEESAATVVGKLPASGDLRVLTRDAAWPRPPWRDVVDAAAAEARRAGAALLVVDTLAFWGQLGAEREKDAGAAQEVMEPLLRAASAGLAVMVVHHARKEGGQDGDAIRGSSALAGAADVLVEVERVAGGGPTRRRVTAVGRWPGPPEPLLVDWDPATGAWRVLEEEARPAERRDEAAQEALRVLGGAGGPLSGAEVARRLGKAPTDGTVRRALERLRERGEAARDGDGWGLPAAGVARLPGLDGAEPRGERAEGVASAPGSNGGNAATGQRCQGGVGPVGAPADGNPPGEGGEAA